MKLRVFALLYLAVLPLATAAEYKNFDECSKSELSGLEQLLNLRSEGHNIRKLLESASGGKLSIDEEYMLYLLDTKPPKQIALALAAQCALQYPDTSPFSKSDIEKMREAREQAMRKIILQNRERIPKK
jgi:hypothetical protein